MVAMVVCVCVELGKFGQFHVTVQLENHCNELIVL